MTRPRSAVRPPSRRDDPIIAVAGPAAKFAARRGKARKPAPASQGKKR